MGEVLRKTKGGKFVGWYLRYIDADGRRKQRASKQPSYAEAKRMLVEIEARIVRGMVGIEERTESSALTVAQLFDRYIEEYRNPRCKDIVAYQRCTRVQLARVSNEAPKIAQLPLSMLEENHIAKVRDALMARYPAGTVRTTLIGVSAALSWAVKEKLIEKNPAKGVHRPPPPPPRLEFLTADEVRRMLEEAERRARAGVGKVGRIWWSRWMGLSLAVRTGMRKGEVFGLRWQDVDLKAQRLTIARSYATTPKSGKARHLRLPSVLIPLLAEWKEQCPSSELVCPMWHRGSWGLSNDASDDHDLYALMRSVGCRPLTRPWHLLRHSFASHFMQSGGSLLALSQILGHSDVKTTMIYAHLSSEFLGEQIEKVKF